MNVEIGTEAHNSFFGNTLMGFSLKSKLLQKLEASFLNNKAAKHINTKQC
jgi:hypothetical protein